MADTERLINKAQGDSIISAIQGITARLQEMYTVDDAMSSSSENPVQNKVVTAALDNKVDKVDGKGLSANDYTNEEKTLVATIPNKADADDVAGTQSVSGNPITLTDCAPINAESLVVELEPKQDLHGQDAPYVGGAGKNKCPIDLQNGNTGTGMSWTIKTDADGNKIGIVLNGTHVDSSRYFATIASIYLESGNYYLSGAYNDNAALELIGDGVDIYNNNAENPTAFTISTNGTYTLYIAINTNVALSNAELKPMIRLSTETDPTFAPYSNICPITGYTECEVDDVGKNKLPMTVDGLKAANTYGTWSGNVYTINGVTLTILTNTGGNVTGIVVNGNASTNVFFNIVGGISIYSGQILNGAPTGGRLYISNSTGTEDYAADTGSGSTISADKTDCICYIVILSGTSLSNVVYYPMLRLSTETDPTFEPYHSSNATIQFGQTVYGGRSNFTEGGTDDEWNKDDTFSGWYKSSTETSVIIKEITDKKGGTNQIYCNTYKYVANQGFGVPLGAISDSTNSSYTKYVFVNDSRFAGKTIQECQAILESDGMYFVYQVDTPTQLPTPSTDLKLLKGTNNITTNGTTITLGYQPDNVIGEVKGEIEKCSPNPEFMHFEVNGNVVDAIPIIFDEAIHSYTVSGDNWKDKTFLCVECCDMRYGILQLVLSSDMAFVDSCGKGLLLYPYMRSIEQYIKISISLGQSYGYEISYQTTNTSSLLDYLKIRVRLFN